MQVWFVAVDPKRDTTEKRKPTLITLILIFCIRPTQTAFSICQRVGLIYAINDSDEQEYAVDHSASVVMVDGDGSVRFLSLNLNKAACH